METFSVQAQGHCSECQGVLSEVERDVSVFGGPPLCDSCRDRRYYETDHGQLELLEGRHQLELEKHEARIAELEQELINERSRAAKRAANDQARIAELEREVEELKLSFRVWPGARSRPSELA